MEMIFCEVKLNFKFIPFSNLFDFYIFFWLNIIRDKIQNIIKYKSPNNQKLDDK